ncbi:MAG: SLBB domain-containing protein [Planctomycetes bacterium]|nr:SLBB domain-containing protein [Planctomycetota bacterium]
MAKPGNYEFSRAKEITLLSLLGLAGGYTDAAKLEEVYLFRTDSDKPNQRSKFQIDLKEIVSNPLTKDVTLQDNDVLILEHRKISNWNKTISDITPTLYVITVILGIIYVSGRVGD